MSTKERREREKDKRKAEILEAAKEILKTESFEGFSMDKIAEKAELSKGALYLYFDSKEDLMGELIFSLHNDFLKILSELVEQEGEFEELLELSIKKTSDYFTENIELFRFIFMSMPMSPDEIRVRFRNMIFEVHEKEAMILTKIYNRFPAEKFRYPEKEVYIALSSLVAGFVRSYILFNSEGLMVGNHSIEPKIIADIFLRGVLK